MPLCFRNESIYDDFKAQEMGTTFVELIKRPGTYLGVVVNERDVKIAQLVPGSWAQRSDVLCVGDRIISVNGLAADSLSNAMLVRTLDDSDRIQLEVRYRLPPQPTILGRRKKVIQVSKKIPPFLKNITQPFRILKPGDLTKRKWKLWSRHSRRARRGP